MTAIERRDGTPSEQIRSLAKANPGGALALVGGNSALAPSKRANLVDDFIGEIGNDEEAARLITEHVTEADRAELLVARSDLPAALVYVEDQKVIFDAIRRDIADVESVDAQYAVALVLRFWALKLKDRADWQEMLQETILDYVPFGDYLILAAAIAVGLFDLEETGGDDESETRLDEDEPSEMEDDDYASFLAECVSLGLEITSPREALDRLRESGLEFTFTQEDVENARAAVTKHAAERPMRADKTAVAVAGELKI